MMHIKLKLNMSGQLLNDIIYNIVDKEPENISSKVYKNYHFLLSFFLI